MASFFYTHKHSILYLCLLLCGFVLGVITVCFINSGDQKIPAQIVHFPYRDGQLTNPLLDFEVFPQTQAPLYGKMEHRLEVVLEKAHDEGQVSEASVYYRDMNSGGWVGINEKMAFSPASLLKVPILMAYLKEAERTPELFDKPLEYLKGASAQAGGLNPNIKPTGSLVSGQKYTVRDLLSAMIVDSDNDAQYSLVVNMPTQSLDQVYVDLGVEIPGIRSAEDFMTVNEYAGFFRILYNSTYLNREMSELALRMLTQVEYDRGLRPGVPADILIAHKFGERGISREGGPEQKQLHDCGIVYYPERPYLLCVMTRGESFDTQSKLIQNISREVFQEVNEFNISHKTSNPLDTD